MSTPPAPGADQPTATDPTAIPHAAQTTIDARDRGRARRSRTPRQRLADLPTGERDPLGILQAQNATRVPELLPLRTERMSASAFAFFRGTAAVMAADLAATAHSGIPVASCGDAHLSNFGFYASPQRTLVFDLNDFDESAWSPWEWDLKRLVASVIIAGKETGRSAAVITDAARSSVGQYATALRQSRDLTPIERYSQHFDAEGTLHSVVASARKTLRKAIADAERRTSARATRKLTETTPDGRTRFVEVPPAMTHLDTDLERGVIGAIDAYAQTTPSDIRLLLTNYTIVDTVRRAVGVGSVGTRCYVTLLVDGDGDALLLQTKEAGESVLAQYGNYPQPPEVDAYIAENGQGGRVVAMQRILQGASDPFLGHFRGGETDYYVRQFRDMKGGIDAETLDDTSFRLYAQACAAVLARAHAQSPTAGEVVGYIGNGRIVTDAIVAWAQGYAEVSRRDYEAFLAAQAG